MAKISARGATEVARLSFSTGLGHTGILVLRSDGKVLRRLTGDTATGYTIMGSLYPVARADAPVVLRKVAAARGYAVTKVGK